MCEGSRGRWNGGSMCGRLLLKWAVSLNGLSIFYLKLCIELIGFRVTPTWGAKSLIDPSHLTKT